MVCRNLWRPSTRPLFSSGNSAAAPAANSSSVGRTVRYEDAAGSMNSTSKASVSIGSIPLQCSVSQVKGEGLSYACGTKVKGLRGRVCADLIVAVVLDIAAFFFFQLVFFFFLLSFFLNYSLFAVLWQATKWNQERTMFFSLTKTYKISFGKFRTKSETGSWDSVFRNKVRYLYHKMDITIHRIRSNERDNKK